MPTGTARVRAQSVADAEQLQLQIQMTVAEQRATRPCAQAQGREEVK